MHSSGRQRNADPQSLVHSALEFPSRHQLDRRHTRPPQPERAHQRLTPLHVPTRSGPLEVLSAKRSK
jgi:hypothetical protein